MEMNNYLLGFKQKSRTHSLYCYIVVQKLVHFIMFLHVFTRQQKYTFIKTKHHFKIFIDNTFSKMVSYNVNIRLGRLTTEN